MHLHLSYLHIIFISKTISSTNNQQTVSCLANYICIDLDPTFFCTIQSSKWIPVVSTLMKWIALAVMHAPTVIENSISYIMQFQLHYTYYITSPMLTTHLWVRITNHSTDWIIYYSLSFCLITLFYQIVCTKVDITSTFTQYTIRLQYWLIGLLQNEMESIIHLITLILLLKLTCMVKLIPRFSCSYLFVTGRIFFIF